MPPTERELISDFCTGLALRPDSDRVRALLARELYEHRDALWPHGAPPAATPQWVEGHVDEVLAVIERLYGEALCEPVAHEFLDRMRWPAGAATGSRACCGPSGSQRLIKRIGQRFPAQFGVWWMYWKG
jgi:hypothetical protein